MARLILVLVGACAVLPADPPPARPDPTPARRGRLRRELGRSLALVPSAPAGGAFRQDNDFRYLAGGDWPDAVLALSKGRAVLFVGVERDALSPIALFPDEPAGFDAVVPLARLDVAIGRYESDGLLVLTSAEEHYAVANVPGERRTFENPMAVSALRARYVEDLRRRYPEAEMEALEGKLWALRQIKDEDEIACLREACRITGESLIAAIKGAKEGMKEGEFQRVLEQGFLDRGADWLAFPSVVGSGKNGTMIHYTANRGSFGTNELVVVDTGAESAHYAADVTRTFPASGRFTARQREVYEAVLSAQLKACAAVKPGTTLLELDAIAKKELARRGFRGKMPHMTSHFIGLAAHDVGDYGRRLEPGMVLTVEPGVYLPEEAIGVRIEDTVLVTKDGSENLSGWIPRATDEIEKLVGSGVR